MKEVKKVLVMKPEKYYAEFSEAGSIGKSGADLAVVVEDYKDPQDLVSKIREHYEKEGVHVDEVELISLT